MALVCALLDLECEVTMSTRILRTALFAFTTFSAPVLASAAPARPVPAQKVASTQAPKAAVSSETSSYAQRDAKDKQTAQFQGGFIESSGGGTVVVISGAALVLVLFLAILVL
jgi:hypothetical protein